MVITTHTVYLINTTQLKLIIDDRELLYKFESYVTTQLFLLLQYAMKNK